MGEKISLGPGTLYIGSERFGDIGELDVTESIYDKPETPVRKMSEEVTIEGMCKINQRTLLSILYGSKLSNNWLKMLGGVMVRKRAYKKIKRS